MPKRSGELEKRGQVTEIEIRFETLNDLIQEKKSADVNLRKIFKKIICTLNWRGWVELKIFKPVI